MTRSLSILVAGSLLLVACGSDSDGIAQQSIDLNGPYALGNRSLQGQAIIDPDFSGQTISLQELDGNLQPSGEPIAGTLTASAPGDHFEFPPDNYESPYLLISIAGHYADTVAVFQLLTDISQHETATITLLSHLEVPRVLHLVQNAGYPFASAKYKANREISLIFGNEDEPAIVEAFGPPILTHLFKRWLLPAVFLRLDYGHPAYVRRIAQFAADLADNGAWDSAEAAAIGDSAYAKAAAIDSVFASWYNFYGIYLNYQDIPAITAPVWYHAYGLGSCAQEDTLRIRSNGNSLSNHASSRFICDEKQRTDHWTWLYAWREHNDDELRLGPCSNLRSAPYVAPDTGGRYGYCEGRGLWRPAQYYEVVNFYHGTCTEARRDTVVQQDSVSYYCCPDCSKLDSTRQHSLYNGWWPIR